MFKCDWVYKIYIPKVLNKDVMSMLSGLTNTYFGGYTKYTEAIGSWCPEEGQAIIEDVEVIEIVSTKENPEIALQHLTDVILGYSKEQEVLVTKSPIEMISYKRKDYHD